MRFFILYLFFVLSIPTILSAQSASDWGSDVVVHNGEPTGQITAVAKPNGTIYAAIQDSTGGSKVLLYKSTNSGNTWSQLSSYIPPTPGIRKMNMIRTVQDSVYLFMLNDGRVRKINVENSAASVFDSTEVSHFAVTTSSTGAIYLFLDFVTGNNLRRYGSVDGGYTWISSGLISGDAAKPEVTMSVTGDTAIINYYGPVLADTQRSVIRGARYRETTPGTLTGVAPSFVDVATETDIKSEFKSARYGNNVWMVYAAQDAQGNVNLKGKLSTDGNTTYGALTVSENPNINEYWFDVLANKTLGRADIIFYADSTGTPSNTADRIMYGNAPIGSTSFGSFIQISQHFPSFSATGYKPVLVEINDAAGDVGCLWVGNDGGQKKVYWDRLQYLTGVSNNSGEVPAEYTLSQNYPNPFNPETKINFSVPKSGLITLKVYDILGKEQAVIISKVLQAGSYTADFNASLLSSGVYFYTLSTDGINITKKMTVVK